MQGRASRRDARGGRGVGFDGMGGKAPHNPCIPCTSLGVHGMQGRASRRDARGGRFPPPTTTLPSLAPLKGCMGCKAVHPEGMQEVRDYLPRRGAKPHMQSNYPHPNEPHRIQPSWAGSPKGIKEAVEFYSQLSGVPPNSSEAYGTNETLYGH
ncbi:hypothetical protein COCOBI_pt-1310 (chloroplast) [Coccomyxa sp. Obi]|nr:hypothetical protein COCOBI_pt-1310 [Coccomyxa sp. Obi]